MSEVECDYFRITPMEAAVNAHNGVHSGEDGSVVDPKNSCDDRVIPCSSVL